ncbi:MAG: hypothetical protein AB7U75_10900 [Hyphomicrobiaceae bacterium]
MIRLPSLHAVSALVLIVASLLLSGCETLPKQGRTSDTQSITIDTPGTPGAQCVLTSATVGRLSVTTPAKIEVDRSPEIIVARCAKRCYLDASVMITSEGQRLASGVVVYSYPEETSVTLTPAASCDSPAGQKGRASPL